MDKSILIQYTDMQAEVKELRWLITATQARLDKIKREGPVSDVVSGGMGGTEHFKVSGFPTPRYTQEKNLLLARQRRLEGKEIELLDLQNQVEEYIESIDKSEMRIMLRLYYIEGLTWRQVADRMNRLYQKQRIPYTEDSCRMKNKRFLKTYNYYYLLILTYTYKRRIIKSNKLRREIV
ncbi:MAG: hypothetical protein LUF92_17220 [Clostridiales bacterium]|nr:hypothetical protein [Clostridiales bacterium]